MNSFNNDPLLQFPAGNDGKDRQMRVEFEGGSDYGKTNAVARRKPKQDQKAKDDVDAFLRGETDTLKGYDHEADP